MEFRKTLDVSTVEIIFLSGVVIRYGHRGPWRYLGSRGGRHVKKELKSAERERGLVRKRLCRVENRKDKRNTRRGKKERKNEEERDGEREREGRNESEERGWLSNA